MTLKIYKENGIYNLYIDELTGAFTTKDKSKSKQSFPSLKGIGTNYELIDLDVDGNTAVVPDVSEDDLIKYGAMFGYKPETGFDPEPTQLVPTGDVDDVASLKDRLDRIEKALTILLGEKTND